jgi:hypothetical protein
MTHEPIRVKCKEEKENQYILCYKKYYFIIPLLLKDCLALDIKDFDDNPISNKINMQM